jgi:hypothetical protein
MGRITLVVAVLIASFAARAGEPLVRWQGHAYREVLSLSALPVSIRQALRADAPGLDGIADRGQRFNAADVVVGSAPRRRLITAGHDGNLWLVVLETGGIAYNVTAVQFSGAERVASWTLPCLPDERPETLKDAVRAISSQGS